MINIQTKDMNIINWYCYQVVVRKTFHFLCKYEICACKFMLLNFFHKAKQTVRSFICKVY